MRVTSQKYNVIWRAALVSRVFKADRRQVVKEGLNYSTEVMKPCMAVIHCIIFFNVIMLSCAGSVHQKTV